MMDRAGQKELIELITSLMQIFQQIDWRDNEQSRIVLDILHNVDDKCNKDLSAAHYGQYHDMIGTLQQTITDTDWSGLGADEIGECRKLCGEILEYVLQLLHDEQEIKREIFFLPYKASMWDSLESVWQAAVADKEYCNAYVVPIPYCDRNPDGSPGEWHCEADLFPEDVPVLDWHDYQLDKLKELQPDAIFIHNPYDDGNSVTSVEGHYYSRELKHATKHLYYIPYYTTSGGMAEGQAMLPAYEHVEAIFVQAPRLVGFFHESIRYKVHPLGSPKFDKVIHLCQNPPALPEGWAEKMQGKKVYFYNTSLGGMLADTEAFLHKMAYVFNTFAGRKDACLLWRPHPLMMSTLKSIRPGAIPAYETLKEFFISHNLGIYDDTPLIETAIAWSDVYIGDTATSVTSLFGVAGKPIFALNNQIHELPGPNDWMGLAFQWFADDYGDWLITWNNCLLHAPNHDYNYEFYCRLHEDQGGGYYNRVIPKGDKLYICPVNTQNILVVKDKRVIKTIPLREEESHGGVFAWSCMVGDKIFLMPIRYPAMVCLDTKDDTVAYIEGTKGVISTKFNDDWLIGGGAIFEDKLYVSSINSAQQLIITPEPLSVEVYDIDPNHQGGFNALVPDGDFIWMHAAQGQEIWKWKPADNSIEKYCGFPEGFTCYHPGLGYECDIMPLGSTAFTDDYLYIVPSWGNQLLKLDKKTGEISQWEAPFSASHEAANGYLHTWGVGGFVWADPKCIKKEMKFIHLPTRKLYHVDIENNTWEEVLVTFDEESKLQMEIGFARMSKWFLYGCSENAFNSLMDLLDGTIHGKQFSHEYQLKAFSDIAANNDGTAGEKIYNYAMKRMATT